MKHKEQYQNKQISLTTKISKRRQPQSIKSSSKEKASRYAGESKANSSTPNLYDTIEGHASSRTYQDNKEKLEKKRKREEYIKINRQRLMRKEQNKISKLVQSAIEKDMHSKEIKKNKLRDEKLVETINSKAMKKKEELKNKFKTATKASIEKKQEILNQINK